MQVVQLYFVDNLSKVSVIDMRYKQGFAVGWKTSPQSE
jgi:cell division septal protein FtsQ